MLKDKIFKNIESLTNGYKQNRKAKILVITGLVGFFIIMAEFLMSTDENKGFDKRSLKIQDPSSGYESSGSLRMSLEDKIEELKRRNKKLEDSLESSKKASSETLEKIAQLEEAMAKLVTGYVDTGEIVEEENTEYELITDLGKDIVSAKGYDDNVYKYKQNKNAQKYTNSKPVTQPQEFSGGELVSVYFDDGKREYDLKNYLPAGSYAKARILSSVDASVGITSQTEPRPVLIEVKGVAKSAMHDHQKLETDIEGCVISAVASGDLSSERGYIRLQSMTCASSANKVIETKVKGYVSSYGKAGVRGRVIEREGDKVRKAFYAGLLANFGKAIAEKYSADTSIVGSVATVKRSTSDIVKQGFGGGFAGAFDRLSQYYIEKMEQIQPVISIPAGLDIEVVFMEGVKLDGSSKVAKKGKTKEGVL